MTILLVQVFGLMVYSNGLCLLPFGNGAERILENGDIAVFDGNYFTAVDSADAGLTGTDCTIGLMLILPDGTEKNVKEVLGAQ